MRNGRLAVRGTNDTTISNESCFQMWKDADSPDVSKGLRHGMRIAYNCAKLNFLYSILLWLRSQDEPKHSVDSAEENGVRLSRRNGREWLMAVGQLLKAGSGLGIMGPTGENSRLEIVEYGVVEPYS
ncbi:hypothetical protein CIHG_06299 [Coccidioides immitis H538.4]|uniref:Uncharacterized protein n=3 Tax=Coccidioides immitis TaxID=5501 RepID=A0A0J8QVK4_COCIT|nr:hypothetical protein CIRG_09580 [Coccidioides immitis RMSCC 2394]KMU75343.1 hypothetical protein CISG_04762 [Coccidioides immitis RMSCC 3703]KMU88499.1 hypothetical protein CIHG_06299 [Coccidioides immitis H538.4]